MQVDLRTYGFAEAKAFGRADMDRRSNDRCFGAARRQKVRKGFVDAPLTYQRSYSNARIGAAPMLYQ